jgi:hypothetical protein
MMTRPTPTVDEVLDQLALEDALDARTVRRYIDAYPGFTGAILDFALECQMPEDALGSATPAMEAAGDRFLDGLMAAPCPPARSGNPLAAVSVDSVEQATGIAGPLVAAMRKGLVMADTIPDVIVRKLVAYLCLTREQLLAGLATPLGPDPALEHKSSSKPVTGKPMPFAYYLENSALTEQEKQSMLTE